MQFGTRLGKCGTTNQPLISMSHFFEPPGGEELSASWFRPCGRLRFARRYCSCSHPRSVIKNRPKAAFKGPGIDLAARGGVRDCPKPSLVSALRAHCVRPNSLPANLSTPAALRATSLLLPSPPAKTKKPPEGGLIVFGWG
jgi:hypothetical protein